MLSLDTVHALVDHLMQLDTGQLSPLRALGTIAVVHDYPMRQGTPDRRGMRLLPLPMLTDHRRHQTLPAALHTIAGSLTPISPAPESAALSEPVLDPFDLAVLRQQVQQPDPGLRLLAWAVCYDDLLIDTDTDTLTRVRRVEALDADGRVYQLSRTARESHPVVLVDEQPDPADLPATYPGLAQLAAATSHPPT